ncbi:MAG: molybdopterin-synthase adenylyltransferase MoeB, partial [Verrucomicrobiota bacterium]
MSFSPVISAEQSDAVELSSPELERYARHITIPDFGVEAQKRLKASSVLCIGLGGLGSPASMYLAAAGIGKMGLVEFDWVDRSNLQRQIVHGEGDIGRPKLESARETLREINPHLEIVGVEERLTGANAKAIAEPFDLILDGTDNFATRYLSNDLAVLSGKPNVYGSIFRFEGQVSVFAPSLGGPCYRCLFPNPPDPGSVPSCAEGGVLGVLPGIIGSMQALEAIKLLAGVGDPLVGRLVHFDALQFKFREIRLRKDEQCPVCGPNRSIHELIDYDQFCSGPETASGTMESSSIPEISVSELKSLIDQGSVTLIDVCEPSEYEICQISGSKLIPLGELPDRLEEIPR